MKSIFKSKFWAMLLVAAMTVGCTESPTEELGSLTTPTAEPVEVSLNLGVEPLVAGTLEAQESDELTESRAINYGDVSEDIANLWVIQFNGTDGDSKVIGSPKYFAPYITDINSSDRSIVTLIPSGDEKNTIVYLANTFKSNIGISVGSKLSELMAVMRDIKSEEGCFTTDESGKKYMPMNNFQTDVITNGMTLNCSLKRNLAKIEVTIVNESKDGDKLDITGLQMCNVIAKNPLFAEQTSIDSLAKPFPANSSVFNYDVEPLTFDAENKAQITLYVPCNMRGVVANSAESSKPVVAPNYSTLLSVTGETDNNTYSYNFFLGENMTDNFNIKPNYKYSYTFTFKGVGDPAVDNRIESLGEIDYRMRESSNCYILNPAASCERSYLIPIEDRIKTFWNEYTSTQIGAITPDSWDIEVLWYDCDNDPIPSNPTTTLTADKVRFEKHSEALKPEAIKVTLGQGFSNDGNIVVAVKDRTSKEILWSWHFWITDYNPDSIPHEVDFNQFQYPVANGEIQRYKGDIWKTDLYKNSFIMDRNLGARDAKYVADYGPGCIYYQFGRKDPFPGNGAKDAEGKVYKTYNTKKLITTNGVSFATAVKKPMLFYYYKSGESAQYDWCGEADSDVVSYLWNDKNTSNDVTSPVYGDKSIFDPSPLGWKMPIMSALSLPLGKSEHTNVGEYAGRTVYGFVYLPATGGITSTYYANLGGATSHSYIWGSSAISKENGYYLYSHASTLFTANGTRSDGRPVRPVKDVK